jgi:hypothetical protein
MSWAVGSVDNDRLVIGGVYVEGDRGDHHPFLGDIAEYQDQNELIVSCSADVAWLGSIVVKGC